MAKVTATPRLDLKQQMDAFLLLGSRPTGQIIYDYICEFTDRSWGAYSPEEIRGITRFLSEAMALSEQKAEAVWDLQHPNSR